MTTDLFFTQGSPAEEFEELPRVPAQRRVALWDLTHPVLAGATQGSDALCRSGAAAESLRATFEREYDRNFR